MNKPVSFKLYNTNQSYLQNNPSLSGAIILIKDVKKLIIDGIEFEADIDIPDVSQFITEAALTQIKSDISLLKNKNDKYITGVSISGDRQKTITFRFSDSSQIQTNFTDIDTVAVAYDDSILKSKVSNLENDNSNNKRKITELENNKLNKTDFSTYFNNNIQSTNTKVSNLENKLTWEIY